ncbi:MFS transporter [Pacificimonas sp. WHA3]|uniref:MFS transporter n=1 Tax=Pacificimonas pallii TaxID=2827236 RepID=A0ABS6SC04_9SPHN|nr:MFS transporter [Pacificimonas pallii]MBV7255944.1 MFS transporter [Pacificimonas pallii]
MASAPGMEGFRRNDFRLLFLVLFTVAAGNTALQSVLPSIGRELQIPDIAIAAIFSLSALFWTLSAPFWAEQSDRRGRKRLVQLGMAGFFLSTLLCALSIFAGLKGLIGGTMTVALFALFRAIFGLFGSASNPAAQAYVAVRTSPRQRTAAISVLASAFGLGTVVGPAVAPFFIFPVVTLSGPLFAFTLVALITLFLVSRYLPKDDAAEIARNRAHGSRRLKWSDPRIRPFVIYGLVVGNAQAAMGQTLGFFIIDTSGADPAAAQALIGLAMMAGAGATLLAQWGLISMFGMGPKQLTRWGAGLALAGTIGMAMSSSIYAITLSFALAMLGYGFARPGFSAGASLAVGQEDQGAAAGSVTSVNGASFILAPTIGVGLYQFGQPLPYIVSAAMLAGLLIYAFKSPLLSAELDKDAA